MERIYINRECCIGYIVMAFHSIFHSANKERTVEDVIAEIRTMFEIYTDENMLMKLMEEILIKEGKNKITINTGIEKIGMTIEECEQLVAELVKLPDFPCVKFKRRILINKLGINDWMTKNIGKFIKY